MSHLSVVERPAVARDRDRILNAIALSLLVVEVEKVKNDPSIRDLAVLLMRNLGSHGLQIKVRR